jgi:hypothetical protein
VQLSARVPVYVVAPLPLSVLGAALQHLRIQCTIRCQIAPNERVLPSSSPSFSRRAVPRPSTPEHPSVLSLTPPALPVQTAHCRATPCCTPLRQPVAAGWGRRQRRGRQWPPAEANGGSGGVKMPFEILIPLLDPTKMHRFETFSARGKIARVPTVLSRFLRYGQRYRPSSPAL